MAEDSKIPNSSTSLPPLAEEHAKAEAQAQAQAQGQPQPAQTENAVQKNLAKLAGAKSLLTLKKENFIFQIPVLFKNLYSDDPPTRVASRLFVLSLAMLIGISGYTVRRFVQRKNSAAMAQLKRKILQTEVHTHQDKKKDEQSTIVTVGSFTVELKPVKDQKLRLGVVNMAQIELVFKCDSEETQLFVKEHLIQAQNQITLVLIALDRDELMTREGKRKIKNQVIQKINGWLPKGKVEDVYFSRLIIS